MPLRIARLAAVVPLLLLGSCARSNLPSPAVAAAEKPAASHPTRREIRLNGLVEAVRAVKISVPRIQGQVSTMTLTDIIPNGAAVKEGDLIATFDPAQQMDAAREAQGKFEDLTHQVEQKRAELRSNSEKRASDLLQAQGELTKATLELQKGPVLSTIDRLKNEARAEGARTHLASLQKSTASREKSEAAALRILELQRDRQKINMQRAQDNIRSLEIRAPLAGMVVHELTYRAGSYGHAQVGDQIYRGYPLVSIFDPSEMQVRCSINEPDIHAALTVTTASVYLDAYPNLAIPAHFVFASPVASSPLGTPIKSFLAVFHIDKGDSHLLPDLSAAVVLSTPAPLTASGGAK